MKDSINGAANPPVRTSLVDRKNRISYNFTDSISFHAEYRARAKYTKSENESDQVWYDESGAEVKTIDSENNEWNFDASTVTFGISLYF